MAAWLLIGLLQWPPLASPSALVQRVEERLSPTVAARRPLCGPATFDVALDAVRLLLVAPDAERTATGLQTAGDFLEALARSELQDHLGGGFFEAECAGGTWRPRFEKRAITNARLLSLFARAYAGTGRLLFRDVADQISAFFVRELRGANGLFFAGLSASAEVGTRHFLWSEHEIRRFLGDQQGREFLVAYRLTDGWLSLAGDPFSGIGGSRQVLLARRGRRVKLEVDTRPDPFSNALAITGLSEAGKALTRGAAIEAARRAARQAANEGLDRKAPIPAAWALISLHDASGEHDWLDAAKKLVDDAVRHRCRIVPARREEHLDCRWEGTPAQQADQSAYLLAALLRMSDRGDGRYARLAHRLETALRAGPDGLDEERLSLAIWEGKP